MTVCERDKIEGLNQSSERSFAAVDFAIWIVNAKNMIVCCKKYLSICNYTEIAYPSLYELCRKTCMSLSTCMCVCIFVCDQCSYQQVCRGCQPVAASAICWLSCRHLPPAPSEGSHCPDSSHQESNVHDTSVFKPCKLKMQIKYTAYELPFTSKILYCKKHIAVA